MERGKFEDGKLLQLKYDPRDPDLIGTVEITKSSLNAFSILENTNSLDAEYAYRDFKELIVELNYFDKEELSTKKQEVFTWVLPEVDPTGWPNRPWDKQNVDYGTLMQSHANYVALRVDFGGTASGSGASAGNVDESKIMFIGDSWIEILKESGVAKSTYFDGRSGENADNFWTGGVSGMGHEAKEPEIPSDASAVVIEFGLNDVSKYSKTQELIEKVHTSNSNLSIFVLRTSHVSDGYPNYTSMNTDLDKYNEEMKKWCDGKDYATYLDTVTKTINSDNGNGLLIDPYRSGTSGDGAYHLSKEGNEAWYKDIIEAIGVSGGTVSSQSVGAESEITSSSEAGQRISSGSDTRASAGTFGVTEGSGDAEHFVTANGVTYMQFIQGGKWKDVDVAHGDTQIRTDANDASGEYEHLGTPKGGMGCGIYSSTSLMSAYVANVNPETTVKWLHTNIGDSSFNNEEGTRRTSINKMLTDHGIPGKWVDMSGLDQVMQAFRDGKPVIVNIHTNCGVWETGGGHFICFCGISQDGKVYTADSVCGNEERLCRNYGGDFENALKSLEADFKACGNIDFWIPDKAPTGVLTNSNSGNSSGGVTAAGFLGYEADQKVTSPVTGKILEIGKYDRLNVYTGETREVEYIKIKVMDNEKYFEDRIGKDSTDFDYETETSYGAGEALDAFYREYNNVCAGDIIIMDGFHIDLETGDLEAEANESDSNSNTTNSTNTNKKKKKKTSNSTGGNGASGSKNPANRGAYKQNEVRTLYNSGQMSIVKEREQAKEDAPFFVTVGVTGLPGENYICTDPDGLEGYYVKEGKYLGITTTTDTTLVANPDPNNPTPDPNNPNPDSSNPDNLDSDNPQTQAQSTGALPEALSNKLTYTYADFAEIEGLTDDYIRIQIFDTDNALVEDVERFWDIPEFRTGKGTFGSVSQEYKAWDRDLEVLAEVCYLEGGGWEGYLTKYNVHGDEEAEFNGYCMGYSVVNKLLEQNKQWYGRYYDSSRTDMSPLVQVVTNEKYKQTGDRTYIWYRHDTVGIPAYNVWKGGETHYSDKDLEFAEFCLTYDCTSVTKKYETVLSSEAIANGYTTTAAGTVIPRAMCQQGGYEDGAGGQDALILVGYEDGSGLKNKDGQFNAGDELWGVDREMESLIEQP